MHLGLMKWRLWLPWVVLGLNAGSVVWADDWPQWRGPQRDGVWREEGILDRFPAEGLKARWRTSIGAGYSGPSVVGGRVYIMDRITKDDLETDVKLRWDYRDRTMGVERVLCLDEATGKIRWTHEYLVKYSVAYGIGPRVTPTVQDGRVYTLGAMGDLYCLDAASGKQVWKKNLAEEYGAAVPLYGFAAQPLVDGDRLITLVGGSGPAVVALNRHTGEEIWQALKAGEPGYSAPLVVTLGGQRQLLVWHGDGFAGVESASGKALWEVPYKVNVGLAITTPAIDGNRVAVSSQYEGATVLEFQASQATPQILWKASTGGAPEREWKKAGFNTTLSTVLLRDGFMYGVSLYGEFCCLNANTGERVWTTLEPTSGGDRPRERWSTVFMIWHRDRAFIFNEKGALILARLTGKGYEELGRAQILEPDMPSAGGGSSSRKVIWAHPAFANRCLFARNNRELVCVSLAAPH